MRFLDDARLYFRTDECLELLRQLPDPPEGVARNPERCHLYWRGAFSRKQAFAVKSFLATQDLAAAELWLWLDAEDGFAGGAENALLRPLLPFIRLTRYDPATEAWSTPLEGRHDLYREVGDAARADFFRSVVLYKHGGLYADMDTMFLRDLRPLLDSPAFADEFCYRWSAHLPYANSAVLRLRGGSDTARALLTTCRDVGSCHPRRVLHFEHSRHLDLLVLPCAFFDPLWPRVDRRDRSAAAPFSAFADFFRPFDAEFPPDPRIRSFRDFFPGAFAYHWHNCWAAPERPDSYFGLFDRELDRILRGRLGIERVAG